MAKRWEISGISALGSGRMVAPAYCSVGRYSLHLLAVVNTGLCSVKRFSTLALRHQSGSADWAWTAFMRTRAFSWLTCWKRRCPYRYEQLRQGISLSRLSSLCWPARCHTTRLETRTKESIHMCEYVRFKLVCEMKVTVET